MLYGVAAIRRCPDLISDSPVARLASRPAGSGFRMGDHGAF